MQKTNNFRPTTISTLSRAITTLLSLTSVTTAFKTPKQVTMDFCKISDSPPLSIHTHDNGRVYDDQTKNSLIPEVSFGCTEKGQWKWNCDTLSPDTTFYSKISKESPIQLHAHSTPLSQSDTISFTKLTEKPPEMATDPDPINNSIIHHSDPYQDHTEPTIEKYFFFTNGDYYQINTPGSTYSIVISNNQNIIIEANQNIYTIDFNLTTLTTLPLSEMPISTMGFSSIHPTLDPKNSFLISHSLTNSNDTLKHTKLLITSDPNQKTHFTATPFKKTITSNDNAFFLFDSGQLSLVGEDKIAIYADKHSGINIPNQLLKSSETIKFLPTALLSSPKNNHIILGQDIDISPPFAVHDLTIIDNQNKIKCQFPDNNHDIYIPVLDDNGDIKYIRQLSPFSGQNKGIIFPTDPLQSIFNKLTADSISNASQSKETKNETPYTTYTPKTVNPFYIVLITVLTLGGLGTCGYLVFFKRTPNVVDIRGISNEDNEVNEVNEDGVDIELRTLREEQAIEESQEDNTTTTRHNETVRSRFSWTNINLPFSTTTTPNEIILKYDVESPQDFNNITI